MKIMQSLSEQLVYNLGLSLLEKFVETNSVNSYSLTNFFFIHLVGKYLLNSGNQGLNESQSLLMFLSNKRER